MVIVLCENPQGYGTGGLVKKEKWMKRELCTLRAGK
jgi:hypothetical protein